MEMKYRNGTEVTDSIGLLISMLVRYPEIGTINYDPESQLLKFNFMLLNVPNEEFEKFKDKVISCLETFHYLEGKAPRAVKFKCSRDNGITILKIFRDVETFTYKELSMIIELVHQEFARNLITDNSTETMLDEDLLVQEEMICHMLENIKGCAPQKKLIAFREEGRVLVFNK